MKSFAQQIGIVLWAVYFTVAISGINLQKLYCQCTDKVYVSLFEIKDDCQSHQEDEVNTQSCCEKLLSQQKQRSCHAKKSDKKDCCGSKTKRIKANIDVLYSSSIPLLPTISMSAVMTHLPIFEPCTFSCSYHIDTTPFYRPPPKRYGTDLRDFIQSYLC